MATNKKIQTSTNYRMFVRSAENRVTDVKKHKKLIASMRKYGFLQCFPIVVHRDESGTLHVKDGQHRLAIAETLGLPVCWVEETTNFDIAEINCAAKVWNLRDYAEKFAANGKEAYQEGLDFAKRHGLPIGTSFALLAGTISFSNIDESYYAGEFKIKDRAWADDVAGIYVPMTMLSSHLKNARFTEACMAVCRVKDFDAKRLVAGAERCRDKLVSYSTRDAFLDMMEDIYNFGRKQLVGLKSAALMAMRERNMAVKAKTDKKTVVKQEAA